MAPQANHLDHLCPEANWWVDERLLVSIDKWTFPNEVGFRGLNNLGALDNLPRNVKDWCKDEHSVVGEEAVDAEATAERRVAVAEHDECHPDKADVGRVWLEPASVGQSATVKTLSLASLVEENVGQCHDDVVDDTSGSNQVDQPCKDLGRAIAELKEGQAREAHDDAEASKRHTALCAVSQESWSTAFKSKSVERTSCAVGVCVASGEDRSDQESVDKVRKTVDAKVLHGNNVWRGSTSATAGQFSTDDSSQCWVIVWDEDADGEGSDDEEDTESPVYSLESVLDVYSWSLGLCSNHRDVLRSDNSEGSGPESCEEAFKSSKGASAQVGCECSRGVPVSESISTSMSVTVFAYFVWQIRTYASP